MLLRFQGLLFETDSFQHSIGHCDRCDEIIEPLISKQWYISMESLAAPAIKAVKENQYGSSQKGSLAYIFTGWKIFEIGQ